MFLTERLSLDAMAAAEEEHCAEGAGEGGVGGGSPGASRRLALGESTPPSSPEGDVEAPAAQPEPHSHEHLSAITAARSIISVHAGHSHGHARGHSSLSGALSDALGAPGESVDERVPPAPPPPPPPMEVAAQSPPFQLPRSHSHGHSHGGHAHGRGTTGHAHGVLVLSLEKLPRRSEDESVAAGVSREEAAKAASALRRRILTAHLLEFSIIIHSTVIGLNLGTTLAEPGPDGRPDAGSVRPVVALIVVLSFHQFFEGLALGSYVADLGASVSAARKTLMCAMFALAVPAGAWAGIGVASAYAATSQTKLWVSGSLSGLTGGMLLFSALITFMAEEFSRDDVSGAAGRRLKRKMYATMMLGAACMALLGIWA